MTPCVLERNGCKAEGQVRVAFLIRPTFGEIATWKDELVRGLCVIKRTRQMYEEYKEHCRMLRDSGRCVADNIKDYMKSFEANKHPDYKEDIPLEGGSAQLRQFDWKELQEKHLLLFLNGQAISWMCPNRFPYETADDVSQWVLWVEGESDEEKLARANLMLQQFSNLRGLTPDKILCYENRLDFRSAPELTHFQVFVHETQPQTLT